VRCSLRTLHSESKDLSSSIEFVARVRALLIENPAFRVWGSLSRQEIAWEGLGECE